MAKCFPTGVVEIEDRAGVQIVTGLAAPSTHCLCMQYVRTVGCLSHSAVNETIENHQLNSCSIIVQVLLSYVHLLLHIVGEKVARVMRPRRDTCSREVLRHKVPACTVFCAGSVYQVLCNTTLFRAYVVTIIFVL